jgi:KipI family sensor histidine kinase inhibitor
MGERAVLIGSSDARRLARALTSVAPEGLEVVCGISSVLVSSEVPLEAGLVEALLEKAAAVELDVTGRHHVFDVILDGTDLEEVSEETGLGRSAIGEALVEAALEVATVGFSPGFGYLSGLRGPLALLRRRSTPRARVPAGSLAVAAGYCALYPQASPGGWWLLGRSDAALFDPTRGAPSLLAPGDTVALRLVEHLRASPEVPLRAQLRPPVAVSAALRIRRVPPGCSIVDDGRRGLGPVGVPRGGAFDPDRAMLVRRLLGDAPGAIEIPAGGFEAEAVADVVIAGIDLGLLVDGRTVPSGVPVACSQGASIEVVRVSRFSRGYLGVAGGPLIEPVLGSMGTDALSATGPGWLEPGDLLGAGLSEHRPLASAELGGSAEPGVLRVLGGPHGSAIGGVGVLDGLRATVLGESNRVGLRLEPAGGPLETRPIDLASFGVVTGAIQAPPDGRLVILGPDHATLGGYPVVGCVIGADLGQLGRLGPGDEVTLALIDVDEARQTWEARRAAERAGLGTRSVTLEDT